MHTFLILSTQGLKNVPSEISHNTIVVEFFIFLLLSSFCPENSTLVQVSNKIGMIYTFLPITPIGFRA